MPRTVWPDCGEGSAAACDSFGLDRGVKCTVYCAVREQLEAHPVTQDTGVEQIPRHERTRSFSSTR